MRMRYLRHLNIGPADRCEFVKWCEVSKMVKVIRFWLWIINHGVYKAGLPELAYVPRSLYILVHFHLFVCSLLLRCMFEV